jgi:hypothetical protein
MNELKKNKITYFKLKETSNTVFYVNHYLKDYKEYSISKFEDMNFEKFVKPTRKVFTDFTF